MINELLLDLKYYFDRLSKFMRESQGISGQVETFFSLLKQVDSYYDEFFSELHYTFDLNAKSENAEITPAKGELLDSIGAVFG